MSVELFQAIGLSQQKARETLKNPALSEILAEVIKVAQAVAAPDQSISGPAGTFLYHIATRMKTQCKQHLPLLVRHVVNGNIRNETQFSGMKEVSIYSIHYNFFPNLLKLNACSGENFLPIKKEFIFHFLYKFLII